MTVSVTRVTNVAELIIFFTRVDIIYAMVGTYRYTLSEYDYETIL